MRYEAPDKVQETRETTLRHGRESSSSGGSHQKHRAQRTRHFIRARASACCGIRPAGWKRLHAIAPCACQTNDKAPPAHNSTLAASSVFSHGHDTRVSGHRHKSDANRKKITKQRSYTLAPCNFTLSHAPRVGCHETTAMYMRSCIKRTSVVANTKEREILHYKSRCPSEDLQTACHHHYFPRKNCNKKINFTPD